jgi:hypothetical protein
MVVQCHQASSEVVTRLLPRKWGENAMTRLEPVRIVETLPPPTDSYRLWFPKDFAEKLFNVPADMSLVERLMLYTLIATLQPDNVLEIGMYKGGSAAIMAHAMDGIDRGKVYTIEPHPIVTEELWKTMEHRVVMKEGYSPFVTADVAAMAGAPFDFAFIDGYHEYEQVQRDLLGVLPFLADQAYILLHDAYYYQVRDGIDNVLMTHSAVLQDCGMISHSGVRWEGDPTPDPEDKIRYGGLRLLVYSTTGFTPKSS